MQKVFRRGHALTQLAVCAMLAACGGGGSSADGSGGRLQVIEFAYPGGAMLLDGPVTLSAVASSGLPVSFESTTPATCTTSGDQLTLVSAGECRVVASQPGGKSADGVTWAPADETSQLFNVLKHTQQVTFAPPDYVLSSNGTSVSLSASSTSGLPVSFATDTPANCAIEGSQLKLLGKGTCAVTASVAGDDNYSEQSVQRFIAVDPLLVADGFDPSGAGRGTSNAMSTKQGGNVTVNPWGSPLNAGWEWCDANSGGDWCYRTVSPDGSTLTSVLHYPEANWSPGGWQYGFNRIDIFAPGLSDFNASGDTASGLRVTTEKALGFTLGINNGLYLAGRPIVLHLDLGKRNGSCNVTLSTLLWPLDGLASYAVSLSAFAVTDACGLADVATASLDDQVRRLPNYNDTENGGPAAYQAALEEMAGARASAMTLLKSSDIARVRFRLMDVNDSIKTDGVYASDVTIKGAVTIQ
jgi:hypothetical protein